jgi:hypothetical protein
LARSEAEGAGGTCGPTWAIRGAGVLAEVSLYSTLLCGKDRHKLQVKKCATYGILIVFRGQKQCCLNVNRVGLAAKTTLILGCFFVAVAVSRSVSAADVTVAKCTVVVIAPWRRDAAGSGRLGAAIRRVNAGGRCMLTAAANIAPEGAA